MKRLQGDSNCESNSAGQRERKDEEEPGKGFEVNSCGKYPDYSLGCGGGGLKHDMLTS